MPEEPIRTLVIVMEGGGTIPVTMPQKDISSFTEILKSDVQTYYDVDMKDKPKTFIRHYFGVANIPIASVVVPHVRGWYMSEYRPGHVSKQEEFFELQGELIKKHLKDCGGDLPGHDH